jgi:hypothetical protein
LPRSPRTDQGRIISEESLAIVHAANPQYPDGFTILEGLWEFRLMSKSVPFKPVLNVYLQDPDKAISYLISALEEKDPALVVIVMQDVMKAQGQAGRSMSFLTKLVDRLQQQDVEEKRIQAIVAEMSESFVDAA